MSAEKYKSATNIHNQASLSSQHDMG